MFAESVKCAAQVETAFAVELQGYNRSASGWRAPDDEHKIVAPGEMFAPLLPARMKQRDICARHRVTRLCVGGFKPIAALTGKRQIVENRFAAARDRENVFDGERLRRKRELATAILANAPGILRHTPPQTRRNISLRNSPDSLSPTPASLRAETGRARGLIHQAIRRAAHRLFQYG